MQPSGSAEDAYPAKPIHMIIPFSAGGPTDIVGRIMANKMSLLLDQQVVVENRTGAGGNIGADVVSKSHADDNGIGMVFTGVRHFRH